MVEVSIRHTEARGGKNICLESYSSNIGEPSAVRDDTIGEFDREEDDGVPIHSNGFHGKPTCHKASASLPTHHGVQHSLNSHGENDGCVGALCDIDAGQRLDDEDGTDDRMEIDGGSEITPSIL